jgi:adenine-specific DNA-methyltransferase
MEKLKMHSPDFTQENIAKLAGLFPNCVTESKSEDGTVKRAIDFDQLRQELSTSIVEGPHERYQLSWPGKREALLTANAPIAKTLRPCREESVDFDTTENIYVEGDNLDALKLLQETYLNKVKMIFADPPYNTGSDLVYEDDFAEDSEIYFERSNQKDDAGNRLVANTDANGRFHSDWLSMMYSRLKLARNLLRDDGLIFISIDDNEQANLKRLCDEIFGEENFIDTIIWKKRYGGGAKEKYLISVHEYALIYAKNETLLENIYIPLTEESIKRYYTQKDGNYGTRGAYRTHPLEATKSMGERQNLVFDIPAPDGFLISPKRQWLWSKDRVMEALEKNEIEFLKDRNGVWSVHTKQYLKDESGNIRKGKAFSLIDDVYTQHGTNEIINLFGNAQIFSFPKPTDFLKKLLQIGLNEETEAIVLDFFSGSASTAHAVMALNAEDGGKRRHIMVQLPEPCDEKSEAFKAGYKTIAEIGKERIRRAGKIIKAENAITAPNLDIGFRVLKIDSSNMKDVYYAPDAVQQGDLLAQVDNIRADRTPEDLLFQVLLDWGVDLALPITTETIAGKQVFFVDSNALAACFESGINEDFVKALAARHPLRAVFRDSGFGSDSVKINIEQIFKLISPATEVKSI